LTSLYTPARDIARALAGHRPPKLTLAIEVNSLGSRTWIAVTAQCTGSKAATVRGCFADLYVHAFDSCADPYPVRTRAINFLPSGRITIRPGGTPVRWEAQVLNDNIRRIAREQDAAETLRAYRQDGQRMLERQQECEQRDWQRRGNLLHRLIRALCGPENVTIRAVVETIEGREVTTKNVSTPPLPPLAERIAETTSLLLRQATRTRINSI
jgi:hypothetical protein